MGISLTKSITNLETICQRQPEFQVDLNKHKLKAISIWKVTQNGSEVLKWPYVFYSTSSYIVIVAARSNTTGPILHPDRTSIQVAKMLFGAQFLCLHMKISKKLMLNNKQYGLSIYSFYGDSLQDETLTRSLLTYYMEELSKYLQFNAGYFCLQMLNESEPIIFNNELKQFIDFQSEQYAQAQTHVFFKEQLFQTKKSMKQSMTEGLKSLYFSKFTRGADKIPHIQIKQSREKKEPKLNKKKQLDQSLPFACEITQINIKDHEKITPKLSTGNIDSSNMIFDQLGMNRELQEVDKIEEFLKGLYLATERASKNYQLLSQKKIKLIVNCSASTCKNWFINDISYKWIDIPDPIQPSNKEFNIECLIYQVADLAGKCLAEPAGVLIHCSGYNPKIEYSGSRSAAILIGIIMSSLKLSYQDALAMVNKNWPIKIPQYMQKQFKNMQKRRKQKAKGFHVYSICSYSKNYPKHLVAKYLCQIQNIQNLQGIEQYENSVFLCIGVEGNKIMYGRECAFREEYEKYAKQHLRLSNKYEGVSLQCTVEPIEKTFRKQPKIQIKQQILHIDMKAASKNAGFLRNQEIVLKYPILRPVWQKKKQDGFYFTIRQKGEEAQVIMNKGMNWIGYESDKQQFFDRIINCYLGHIPHEKILILESQQEKSLFDTSEINL